MKSNVAATAQLQLGPFVSYSRKDQAFVRKLHDALEQRGRDAWVDWEGILPTEEWMQKIRSAIDSAQAFVFIISPDSINSVICTQEIDHAVAHNKRLLPIVARDVDAAAVHPSLGALNWIYIRDSDDFERKIDELIVAMDTDLDWVRAHTRLQVRADEWQKRGTERSLLLRGNDLREAERWLLQTGQGKKPDPTPVHTQFIITSRQAETRRRKVQRTLAIAALVVLSLLSIYSWNQKTVAERQRNVAVSRQLAMRTFNIAEDQKLTRLLVSALATRYSHTSEADASLARALLPTVPLKTVLWSPHRGDPMTCIAFSRDGTYVAGSNTHAVTIWRTATARVAASLPREDGVDCVSFGADDEIVAIADEGRVILWEWRAGRHRLLGGEPNATASISAFGADGNSMFVASKGKLTHWDIKRTSARTLIDINPVSGVSYAFSPDAKHFAYASAAGQQITVWNLDTEKPIAVLERMPGKTSAHLAFSADGQMLAGSGDHEVAVWDLRGGNTSPVNRLGDVTVKSLAFSLDGKTLALGGFKSEILQWDFRKGQQRWPLPGPSHGTQSIAFSPDGTLLASSGDDGSVLLWEPAKQHQHILEQHADVELVSEAMASDGRMLALKRGEGYLLWDPTGAKAAQRLIGYPDGQRKPTTIHFSRRGKLLAALDPHRGISLWNIDDGKLVKQLTPQQSTPERMEVSPTDSLVATVDIAGRLLCRHIATGVSWSKDESVTGHARSLAFSLDGKWLASGGLEGDVHIWSSDDGTPIAALKNPDANVLALAFSPDGKRLTASAAGAIVMWDIAEKTVRRTLRGHQSSVTSLAFSADGKFIASGSLDKRAILWDALSGEAVLQIDAQNNAFVGVALSGDGKTLATRSGTTNVRCWNIDVQRWTEIACSIVNRNLTREEWETFLPGESYRPACPDSELPQGL